jgi:hypothetical protein
MKLLFMAFLSLFVISCSSPTVHIYKKYLSDQQTAVLSEGLKKSGYKVETNDLDFPEEIHVSTFVYSPFIKNENSVRDFIEILRKLGWDGIDAQPFFKGNHWFSKNSIGLFLIPEGTDRETLDIDRKILQRYQSKDCETPITLALNPNGTFQYHYPNSSHNSPELYFENKTGEWELIDKTYIKLLSEPQKWNFFYQIDVSQQSDALGTIDVVTLKPVASRSMFPKCDFVFGIRN